MSAFTKDNQKTLKFAAIGVLSALVMTVLLTVLFGFILKMASGIPYGILSYVMIGIEGVSVLTGAYIASVIAKSKGLILGVICGAVVLLLLFACGFSIPENNIGILTLIRAAVILLCGVIGGIAGVNRKEKVRIK